MYRKVLENNSVSSFSIPTSGVDNETEGGVDGQGDAVEGHQDVGDDGARVGRADGVVGVCLADGGLEEALLAAGGEEGRRGDEDHGAEEEEHVAEALETPEGRLGDHDLRHFFMGPFGEYGMGMEKFGIKS